MSKLFEPVYASLRRIYFDIIFTCLLNFYLLKYVVEFHGKFLSFASINNMNTQQFSAQLFLFFNYSIYFMGAFFSPCRR